MRILVAEDEVTLATQVSGALSAEGHVIDMAHDGEEVKFLGETEPYDLIPHSPRGCRAVIPVSQRQSARVADRTFRAHLPIRR